MSSDRQVTANRKNAKNSTGPRSKRGRETSARNARRHGLAIAIGKDLAFRDDIESLAKVLSNVNGMRAITERARDAAEASIDMWRIRKIKAYLYSHLDGPSHLTELNEKLAKLKRYERRAFSKRKRALGAISF